MNQQGNFREALSLHRRALKVVEQLPNGGGLGYNFDKPTLMATILNNLAVASGDIGDHRSAVQYMEQVVAIRRKVLGENHPEVGQAMINLGAYLHEAKEHKRAMQTFEDGIAVLTAALGPNHRELAVAYNNLSFILESQGQHDLARMETLQRKSLTIWEKLFGEGHPHVLMADLNLAKILFMQGRHADAKPLIEHVGVSWKKVLPPNHPVAIVISSRIAQLRLLEGKTAEAHIALGDAVGRLEAHIRQMLRAGTETQRRQFLKTATRNVDYLVSIGAHARQPNFDALSVSAVLAIKGRTLDAMRSDHSALRGQLSPTDQSNFDELQRVRSQLAQAIYRDTSEDAKVSQKDVSELQKRAQELEEILSASSGAFAQEARPINIAAIRAKVAPRQVLVEYYVVTPVPILGGKIQAPHYMAYVLRKGGDIAWVDMGERKPIDEAVARFRKTMVAGDMSVLEHGHALHKLMMAPLMPHLKDVESLIISPDGALNLVPFAALVDANWEILLQRYAIRYVTSARDLLVEDAIASREPALIVAAPAYSNEPVAVADANTGLRSMDLATLQVKALPGTRKEAQSLQKHLHLKPDRILLGKNATETALKGVHGPQILHVATHGFFLPKPHKMSSKARGQNENPLLRTGLALAGFNLRDKAQGTDDGVMTGLELAGLDLYGTELVVLSACETGLGEVDAGEGVYGLKRALVLAGSRTQVVSLWKVSDAETRALMSAYYQRLSKGEDRVEAMRQVQLSLYGDQQKHPVHWAAFVVSGAAGPISLAQ